MSLLRQLKIDFNAKAIAAGTVALLEERGDDNRIACIRFGMLPKDIMDMLEGQIEAKFKEVLGIHPDEDYSAAAAIGIITDPDKKIARMKDGSYVEFSFKALMREAMHEIALGFYGSVKMVV